MYNAIKNMTQKQRIERDGGMINPRGVKAGAQISGPMTQTSLNPQPIKTYKPFHGSGQGPLMHKAPSYTFLDLIQDTDDEMLELKDTAFEDWVFPDIVLSQDQVFIKPTKTITRGGRGSDTGTFEHASVTQYIYVVLNPSLNIVQSFGDYPGTTVNKSNTLVCVEVGDPRTGQLDGAFIQYAIRLSDPVSKVADCTMVIPNGDHYSYLYKMVGNPDIERAMFDRWFGPEYYFNAVIFPKVRAFMIMTPDDVVPMVDRTAELPTIQPSVSHKPVEVQPPVKRPAT